jgi:hypothetical protein
MSATELIAERSQRLTEAQAQVVLAYMDELAGSAPPTAKDLMNLPPAVRRKVLAQQARRAEAVYRDNAGMIADELEPPLEHE